jgi:threonine/homoserine/homoserine lactone efflux protein
LLFLGVQALRAARRGAYDVQISASRVLPRSGFAMGLVTNAANPKAAVFTFAFYPQFIPSGYPLLPTAAGLGLLQVMLETGLYLAFAALIGRVSTWFARAQVRRRLDALCGGVLVALGLRVATESH